MQAQDADSKRTTSKRTRNNRQNVLNSARADLISIDQTTALICASVLTRARYRINGVNEVSVTS